MTSRYSKTAAAMSPRITLGILLLCCSVAFGQEFRLDIPLQTSGPNVPVSGGPLPQTLWVANATVYVCSHPSASLIACQNAPITTYTDSTGNTACPTTAQLVQLPGNTCTSNAGTTANVGIWYAGGQVDYWIVSSYGTFGPFTANTGGGGGAGNPSPPAFAVQIANTALNGFNADANININTATHNLNALSLNGNLQMPVVVADSGITDNGPIIQAAINRCPLTTGNVGPAVVAAARTALACEIRIPSGTGGNYYDVRTQVYLAETWNANLSSSAGTVTVVPTTCISGCAGTTTGTIAGIGPNVIIGVYSTVTPSYDLANALVTGGTGSSFTYVGNGTGTTTGFVKVYHSVYIHGENSFATWINNDTGQNWWLIADSGQYSGVFTNMTLTGGFFEGHTALLPGSGITPIVAGQGLKGTWKIEDDQLIGSPNYAIYIPLENNSGGAGWFNHWIDNDLFSSNCGDFGLGQNNSNAGFVFQNRFWRRSCAGNLVGAATITGIAVSAPSTGTGLLNTLTVTETNTFAAGNTVSIVDMPAANNNYDGNYNVISATGTQWVAAINAPTATLTPTGTPVAVLSSLLNPELSLSSTGEILHDDDFEGVAPDSQSIPYIEIAPFAGIGGLLAPCKDTIRSERFGSEPSGTYLPPRVDILFGPLVPVAIASPPECAGNIIEDNRFEGGGGTGYPSPISGTVAIGLNIGLTNSTFKGNRFGEQTNGTYYSGALIDDEWQWTQTNPFSNTFSAGNLFADDNTITTTTPMSFGYLNWQNTNGTWTQGGGNGWAGTPPSYPGRSYTNLLASTSIGGWTPTSDVTLTPVSSPKAVDSTQAYSVVASDTSTSAAVTSTIVGGMTGPGYFTCQVYAMSYVSTAAVIFMPGSSTLNWTTLPANHWTQLTATAYFPDTSTHTGSVGVRFNQNATPGSIYLSNPAYCTVGNTPLNLQLNPVVPVINLVKNAVPDSGIKSGQTYWTLIGGSMTIQHADPSYGGNYFQYTGTGSPSGSIIEKSGVIDVVPGQTWTLSACASNLNQAATPTPYWGIFSTSLGTQYAALGQPAGTASCLNGAARGVVSWTVPGGVTQVVIAFDTANTTTTSGDFVTASAPQFELGGTEHSYVENNLDDVTGYIPGGAIQQGSSSNFGALECGSGTTCSGGVISASAGGGVSSINSTAGAFTFTGGGVSCTSTTCTFSGAGSGVSSFNSRTGAVVPANSDYAFSMLSGSLGTAQDPSSLTGLLYDTAGTLSAATSSQIVAAISTTAVTNATNATNVGTTASTASGTYYFLAVPSTSGNQGAVTVAGMTIDPATGAVAFPGSITAGGTGASIRTGTTSNTDLAGQLTLSGGTASYSFAATYTNPPFCVVTDNSALNAVEVVVTASALTITGTGTDKVTYICVATD